MTTLTFHTPPRSLPRTPAFPRPNVLTLLLLEWRMWRANRALSRFDDATLSDIGVGRSEIDAAVRFGRTGSPSSRA